MTTLYSPTLNILSTWKTTIQQAWQSLRKIRFVIEDTFSFGNFDPKIQWGGMTVTNAYVYRARYLKIFNMMWVSLYASATVAAPLSNGVSFTIPATASGNDDPALATSIILQGGGCVLRDILSYQIGFWRTAGGSDLMYLDRTAGTFAAGLVEIFVNAFIEVK